MAIRKIDADLGDGHADSFADDKHPDLRADFVLANPPFNQDDWSANTTRDAISWPYGAPPEGNGNFAWVQLFLRHLAPGGRAGFVLANGSLDARDPTQLGIRRRLVEERLVECVVTLPTKLFATTKRGTSIPVCLWFLAKDRKTRLDEVLFIDAREMGTMIGRRLRVLSDEDIATMSRTYRDWRTGAGGYADVPGFCASASRAAIAGRGWSCIPGAYIAAPERTGDETSVEELRAETVTLLEKNIALASRLADVLASLS